MRGQHQKRHRSWVDGALLQLPRMKMLTSCDSQGGTVRLQPRALPTAAPATVHSTELLGFAQSPLLQAVDAF